MTLGDAVRPGLPAGVAAGHASPSSWSPGPAGGRAQRDKKGTGRGRPGSHTRCWSTPPRGRVRTFRSERRGQETAGRWRSTSPPPSRASSALKAALQRSVAPAGGLPGAQGLGDGAALSLLSQVPQSPCPRQAVGSRERQTSAPRSGGGALRPRQTESSEWIPLSAAMHGGPQNSGQLGPRRSGWQWTAG